MTRRYCAFDVATDPSERYDQVMRIVAALAACVVLATACASHADKPAARAASITAQQFVERFYDWYSPLARETAHGPAWNAVLNDSSGLLSAELLTALRTDSAAQAAAVGEIAGIDFDPFLNSQDPCEAYTVGLTSHFGNAELVEVRAVCGGRKRDTADVVVELEPNGASWDIRNVRYPNIHTDLLSVLHSSSDTSAAPGDSQPTTAHEP